MSRKKSMDAAVPKAVESKKETKADLNEAAPIAESGETETAESAAAADSLPEKLAKEKPKAKRDAGLAEAVVSHGRNNGLTDETIETMLALISGLVEEKKIVTTLAGIPDSVNVFDGPYTPEAWERINAAHPFKFVVCWNRFCSNAVLSDQTA